MQARPVVFVRSKKENAEVLQPKTGNPSKAHISSLDPRIPQLLLAVEREIITRSVIAEMDEQRDLERKINARLDSERFRRSVAGFHTLKKSPEAADPESPVAEKVRRLNRERRNELGRPGKRKRE